MTEAEIQAGEIDPRQACRRLHARASTAASGENVVVAAADLRAVLDVLGPPPPDGPPKQDPPPPPPSDPPTT